MKVLITNGSNPVTWYFGRQGELLPVTHIQDRHYFVPDQHELGPTGVHFSDGELLYTVQECNELKQANLMHVEDNRTLMNQVERLRFDLKAANHGLQRKHTKVLESYAKMVGLKDELDAAKNLNKDSLAIIERGVDEHKPVTLPKVIYDALKYYDSINIPFTKYGVMNCIMNEPCSLAKDARMEMFRLGIDDLVFEALINGYTCEVDEVTGDDIQEDLNEIYDQWVKSPGKFNGNDDRNALTKSMAERIKAAYSKH